MTSASEAERENWRRRALERVRERYGWERGADAYEELLTGLTKKEHWRMRSWVEISRRGIAASFAAARALVGPDLEAAAVLKANAYEHGAVDVSRVLETEGARRLAVTAGEEGVELRQAGLATRMLVMSDSLRESRAACFEHNLTPVVHALEPLPPLNKMARKAGRALAYHLNMDSGMGRLGTRGRGSGSRVKQVYV